MSSKVPDIDFSKISFTQSSTKVEYKIDPNLDIIDTVDEILDLLDDRFIIVLEKLGLTLEDCKSANTWFDIQLDDYDQIELVMEIEKLYDCNILDVAAEKFTRIKPSQVFTTIIKKRRDSNISDLLK